MYATSEDQAATTKSSSFRAAEKKYRRHLHQQCKLKRGKAHLVERPTDFSDVIDVDDARQLEARAAEVLPLGVPSAGQLFGFSRHPGFFLIRSAMSRDLQRRLVVECLAKFPQPPAHSNLALTHRPLPGLWSAALAGLSLSDSGGRCQPNGCSRGEETRVWSKHGGGVAAAKLLRKLRWACIGPPFDWTQRVYVRDVEHSQLPPYLADIAINLAAAAAGAAASAAADGASITSASGGSAASGAAPPAGRPLSSTLAAGSAAPFCPDAALVNYYYAGDTLFGHKDDAEEDLGQPLVGLSLGCPGILLIGGESKDVEPSAVLLRSGDAVVLSGPARRCFHGVPRILPGVEPPQSSAEGAGCGAPEEHYAAFERHMRGCRINISIRATL